MTYSPLFSIVIPTRNRAYLLPNALKSALNQEFDDYEIVIVANNCLDNTKEVVHKLSSSRVRYFETEKMLTMPENWEFAWKKAIGKYVIYLSDDDALVPSALKILATHTLDGNPSVISWEDAVYYYPNWNDSDLQNLLLIFFYNNNLVEDVDANIMHELLASFEFEWSSPIPKLLNCAAKRSFFEDWRKKLGQLFFPIAPDYSFAWIATKVCNSIRVVHRPLSLRGISDYSIGSNAGLGGASKEFFNEFGNFDFFSDTQIDLPLSINHVAATFLRVNSALSKYVSIEQLNQNAFYIALAKQLVECKTLLNDWDIKANILREKVKQVVPTQYNTIHDILSSSNYNNKQTESIRELHKRTKNMALEYLPNIETQLKKHDNDLDCALCRLALKSEVLAEANWSYLYLFGEKLSANNIYDFTHYVDRYYDLLVTCKNKKCAEMICKNCGEQERLTSIFNFNNMPLANRLLTKEQLTENEPSYHLELIFCQNCSLVQLKDTVPHNQLFDEYLYYSSYADTMIHSAKMLVEEISPTLSRGATVIEIASNDGYLLQHYNNKNINILGIEPAKNIAEHAIKKGIPTLVSYFSKELAEELVSKKIKADIIHANNVLAHVSDINNFVAGIKLILNPFGQAIIEVPYVKHLINNCEFDTIYHEHVFYFSLLSLSHIFERHGLIIKDVKEIPIHGGSLRLFVNHQSNANTSLMFDTLLAEEKKLGMNEISYYQHFSQKILELKNELIKLLHSLKANGHQIAAYGASAKGSTLLNYFGIGNDLIDFIVDRNPAKQGHYMSGKKIPIYSTELLLQKKIPYTLLLTWNFAQEILVQQNEYRMKGGKFIIPIPKLEII